MFDLALGCAAADPKKAPAALEVHRRGGGGRPSDALCAQLLRPDGAAGGRSAWERLLLEATSPPLNALLMGHPRLRAAAQSAPLLLEVLTPARRYLPPSPSISLHLPPSPSISLYLPLSPPISPSQVFAPARRAYISLYLPRCSRPRGAPLRSSCSSTCTPSCRLR